MGEVWVAKLDLGGLMGSFEYVMVWEVREVALFPCVLDVWRAGKLSGKS